MFPFFSKNAILAGIVDYYCLVCEIRLLTVDDTITHIKTKTHQENLQEISEGQEDGIVKIKSSYYCEFCGLVLKTKPKVRLHILEPQHGENTSNKVFARYGNTIIAFGNLRIDYKAWDGLCDNTCILCNCEYEDMSEHLKDYMHHVNLIQNNVEFSNNNIFRIVDDTSFHCMTCNSLEALPVNYHFDSEAHKTVYKKSQVLVAEIIENLNNNEENILLSYTQILDQDIQKNKPESEQIIPEENVKSFDKKIEIDNAKKSKAVTIPAHDEKDSPVDNINKDGKLIDRTEATETEAGNKESIDLVIIPDNTVVESQFTISEPNEYKNKNQFDIKAENDNICKVLKTQNYITEDLNGASWCFLCDWVMDKYKINSHITGVHHQNILKLHEMRMEKLNVQDNEDNKSMNHDFERQRSQNKEIVNAKLQHLSNLSKKTKCLTSPVLKGEQNVLTESRKKVIDNCLKIQQNLENFQDCEINLEKSYVNCKLCSAPLSFDYEAIERHIAQHKEKINVESIIDDENQSSTQLSESRSKILVSLKKFQSNYIDINFETERVTCKKCSINIDFDVKRITKHVADHKKNKVVKSQTCIQQTVSEPIISEEEKFANANNLIVLPSEQTVNCDSCNTQLPFSLKYMKEHIHSETHKSQLEENKIKVDTTLAESFIQDVMVLQNQFFHDIIINKDICINIMSFSLLAIFPNDIWRCLCCDEYNIASTEIESHIKSLSHIAVMASSKVIIHVKDEFIRQVNRQQTPSVSYHCGYCNILVTWQEMTRHLTTNLHKESKSSAKWRLQSHTSNLSTDQQDVPHGSRFTFEYILKKIFP